jgi:hypothetical protein
MGIAGRTIGMRRAYGAVRRLFDTVDKITRCPIRVRMRHMFHALLYFAQFRLVSRLLGEAEEGKKGRRTGRQGGDRREKSNKIGCKEAERQGGEQKKQQRNVED